MIAHEPYTDIAVSLADRVGTIEIRRPPNNYFDRALIAQLREAFETFDRDGDCRALVLCAQGKNFCSGANFAADGRAQEGAAVIRQQQAGSTNLYKEAVRLFRISKPVVAAVQGAAVGGGLGLAMVADFRVTCAEGRFCANFTRLGTHPGFGLTVTLPRLIGTQATEMMFYTGDRIPGDRAVEMGLADLLVPLAEVRSAAVALATKIAQSAPLAVKSTRATMRRGLADAVEAATDHEFVEQDWLFRTADFREGVRAMAARTLPDFKGN
jgi:enoyl-CoA hydratase/carnithine racemase